MIIRDMQWGEIVCSVGGEIVKDEIELTLTDVTEDDMRILMDIINNNNSKLKFIKG